MLQRSSDGIMIYKAAEYYTPIFEDSGLQTANSVNAPGTSSLRPDDSVELLNSEDHSTYRRTVGKLRWQSPIRPDISYAIKELAHRLSAPATNNEKCLKHLLRHPRGTLDYKYLVMSDYNLPPYDKEFSIQVLADADWAGCATTRKSTTGVIVQVLNSTAHQHSKAQSILATSLGESEQYALGSARAEALHVRTCLLYG